MRILIVSIILFLNHMLQATYIQHIRIRGVVPNIAIIIIVSFALIRGSLEGAIVGFFAGLLQDMYYGTTMGFYSLLGMYIGYICGKPNQKFYRENYLLPFGLVVASTFMYEIIIYVTSFLIRGKTDFTYFLNHMILPCVVYTGVVSLFIYRIIYVINEKLEQKEKLNRRFFR